MAHVGPGRSVTVRLGHQTCRWQQQRIRGIGCLHCLRSLGFILQETFKAFQCRVFLRSTTFYKDRSGQSVGGHQWEQRGAQGKKTCQDAEAEMRLEMLKGQTKN